MPDNNLGGRYMGVHCTAFQLFMFKTTGEKKIKDIL